MCFIKSDRICGAGAGPKRGDLRAGDAVPEAITRCGDGVGHLLVGAGELGETRGGEPANNGTQEMLGQSP
jgi:hypothetical protein